MAWLDGFSNRFKLKVPATVVSSSLTDFPVMISLNSAAGLNNFDATAVFDELSDNDRRKIAVTTSDGTTQCPVEIEYWNSEEEKAILWSKIPNIYSTSDTEFYFYYDATYSGTYTTVSGATVSGNASYVGEIADTTYQMVVNYNIEGSYDTSGAMTPTVIKDGNVYKMWYTGFVSAATYNILYCTSIDGISWTGHQLVLAAGSQGSYDTQRATAPCVIKDGSTYKMWYSGFNGSYWRIIYADSTNGTTWTNFQLSIDKNQEVTYDWNGAYSPCVIKSSDNSYKVWYSGNDSTHWRIIHAISDNGTTWSGFQMVMNYNLEGTYDTTHVYFPSVVEQVDNSYMMWYTAYSATYNNRILKATSPDGYTWSAPALDLDKENEGTYDTVHVAYCCVIDDGTNSLMYHTASDGSNSRILRATYWQNVVWDVWDDDYLMVWHFEQDPSDGTDGVKDSTRNRNHGTTGGSMTSGDLVDCKVGKGYDLDGANDYITVGAEITESLDAVSFEAVAKIIGVASNSQCCLYRENDNGWNGHGFEFTVAESNRQLIMTPDQYPTVPPPHVNSVNTVSFGSWYHLSATYAKSGTGIVYINGKKETTETQTSTTITSDFNGTVGWYDNTTGVEDWNDMEICELRLSTTQRSDAWMKASYLTSWDSFIIFDETTSADWLSDWAKRIQLTIDHTKVDSVLYDFPVALTLASGTGITNADVTDVFTELTASGTNDTYTKLILHMNDTNLSDSSIYDHVVTIVNDVYRSAIQSKFGGYSAYFEGNTDDTLTLAESIDWYFNEDDWTVDFWVWRDGSQSDHAGIFSTIVNSLLDAYCIGFGTGATLNKIRIRSGASGSYVDDIASTDVIPNQTWTHIAFVRYLDVLYLYINGVYDNSINCAGYTFVAEPGYGAVIGKLAQGYSGYYFKGYIDELRVSKGIARWTTASGNFSVPTQQYTTPAYIDPSEKRKKIALTADDGITQCPVEIEYWSSEEERAVLWTKVPFINPSEDTVLYLYYDSTKQDNTTYIGDTGETAAQQVWDENFVGVFHLAQEPSGTVKNSTNVGIDASGSFSNYNVATGKTVSQSSTNTTYYASLAVDGDTGTFQSTNTAANEWWKVDLGAVYRIALIGLYKRAGYGTRPSYYYIQTADNYAFTANVNIIITENNETSSGSWKTWTDTDDFGFIETRYLRVYAHTNAQYLNIAEFKVIPYALTDGKVGKAIEFDGSTTYIYTTSADDAFNITETLTTECIFKPNYTLDSGLSYSLGFISRAHYPTLNQDTYAFLINTSGLLHFGSYGGNIQGTTASWSSTEWHYVAGTYNSTGLTGDLFNNNLKETLTTDNYDTMAGATNSLAIGINDPTNYSFFPGIIDEVRISNIVRSDAWIKTTYYSNFDQLVTYGSPETPPILPTHYYSGYITELGSPVSRAVRLYLRSTGELIDSTTSNSTTGYYYLTTTVSGEHFIVAFDDDVGAVYNALINDRLLPLGIE